MENKTEKGIRSNKTGLKYINAHNEKSVWLGVGLQL